MTRQKLSPTMKRNEDRSYNSSPSYVHSRITIYHASKIDLKYCRSFHSCGSCRLGQVEDQCGAVHFGVCAAVARPASKIMRKSGYYSTFTPASQTGKYGVIANFRSGNFVSATNPGNINTRKTRSLAILREGHELAGTPLDYRATAHPSGLFRLNPQRQDDPDIRIDRRGDANKMSGADVAFSGRGSHRGQGMAITISSANTNLSREGGTDIQIKGQGSEIRIKSSGGQNIRFHPAAGSGALSGHVIKIKGQSDNEHVQHLQEGGVRHAHQPRHVDNVDYPRLSSFPGPPSLSIGDKLHPQKPIARVAPALAGPSTTASPQTSIPDNVASPQSPTVPLSPESHNHALSIPAVAVSSNNVCLFDTSAVPSSQSSEGSSPVASERDINQPFISGNAKDNIVGNQSNLAASLPHKQTSDSKDVSDQGYKKRRLFQPDAELFRNNHKIDEENLETFPDAASLQDQTSDSKAATGKLPETSDKRHQHQSRQSISLFHVPQFYFPLGKPSLDWEVDKILQKVSQLFSRLEGGKAYKKQMGSITKACGFPLYWKILLFRDAGGLNEGFVTYESLSDLLRKLFHHCHDSSSRFMRLTAKPEADVLEFEDFEPLVQDIIETHPGLTFLQDAPEFHTRYVITVISRIMFSVNRSWTGKITLAELRKSNFLQTVLNLELEDDINQITDFFSYEHFYVIYCKFWELDTDHDLFIDRNDLSQYNDHALSSRIIDKIFSGAVTRGADFQEGRMNYKEFVWFLMAEVDKKHSTSIEYWFRCMDLDGDGVISMYEMEYFHEEQMIRLEALGIERLPFEDTVCQMMDMVNPKMKEKITLHDLKACKMTDIFFDTFINLDKFLEHEQKDPFANARDLNAEHYVENAWNRYAEEEYDNLVASEGSAELDNGNCEENYEFEVDNNDDDILSNEELRVKASEPSQRSPSQFPAMDDIYTFNTASKTAL